MIHLCDHEWLKRNWMEGYQKYISIIHAFAKDPFWRIMCMMTFYNKKKELEIDFLSFLSFTAWKMYKCLLNMNYWKYYGDTHFRKLCALQNLSDDNICKLWMLIHNNKWKLYTNGRVTQVPWLLKTLLSTFWELFLYLSYYPISTFVLNCLGYVAHDTVCLQ